MAGRLNAARLAPLVIWLGICTSTARAQDVAPALVGRWDAVTRSAGAIGEIIELRADGSMTHWYAAMVEFTYVVQGSLLITSFTPATGGVVEQTTTEIRFEGDALIQKSTQSGTETRMTRKRAGGPHDALRKAHLREWALGRRFKVERLRLLPSGQRSATLRPACKEVSCLDRLLGGPVIERRTFMAVMAGGLLAAPLAAQGQTAGKVYRVGILSTANPRSASIYQAFEQRLRELGYLEGQNLAIEFRYAEGKVDRLPGLTAELVRLNVNVIVAATDPGTRAAKGATANIPIVMLAINYDPIALGYIASLARPGANVTGLFFQHRELTAKRFGLFKEMLPTVSRVAVLSDSETVDQLKEVEAANRSVGLKLQPLELRNPPPYDFQSVFREVMRSGAEAVFVLESAFIFRERAKIAQLGLKHRLPTSFAFREYVEAGGLISYGVNFLDMWRRAAEYADKVLKGAKPSDLPVERPTKFELVINLKTAQAIGLTIPQSLLGRADEVIQ